MKEFFRQNRNILYWIILVIVALVVGGMILFQEVRIPIGEIPATEKTAVKEETNTSNWQTFQNEEYGLEVRYPEGWYVVTEYMKDINNIIRGTNTSFYDEKNNFRIALDNPGKEIGRGMDLSLLREEKIENSGITITKFIFETSTSDKDFLVLARWSGNGTAGEFVYWYSNSGGKYPNETIPNQILSTFKFIEPSPQIDTSTWQTFNTSVKEDYFYYQEGDPYFTIKYPPGFSGSFVDLGGSFSIYERDNRKNSMSIDSYPYSSNYEEYEDKYRIVSKKEVAFSDYQGTEYVIEVIDPKAVGEILLSYGGGLYTVIKLNINKDKTFTFVLKQDSDKQLFNQILSTFKFIESTSTWQTYRNEEFGFEVKYPSNWSWEENGNATFFLPPQAISKQESISIVIINYKETPPLPVQYIYKTIRTVQSDNKQIPVQEREPSPVTELYIAEIKKGDYTAEFRFSLDRKYDDVFDNMLSTFKFIDKKTADVECPQDVKICPYGGTGEPSYPIEVKRIPPTCEFAPCPGS